MIHQCILVTNKGNVFLGYVVKSVACKLGIVLVCPLLSPGEATCGALCPVIHSLVQERHGLGGASSARDHKDD